MSNKENRTFTESGAQYPFKVPEGYFDNLTARIMEQIPEEKEESAPIVSLSQRKRTNNLWIKVLSAAASLVLIAIVSTKVINKPTDANIDNTPLQMADYTEEDAYNEDLVLYSMVDNSDIYDYLSGGYEN